MFKLEIHRQPYNRQETAALISECSVEYIIDRKDINSRAQALEQLKATHLDYLGFNQLEESLRRLLSYVYANCTEPAVINHVRMYTTAVERDLKNIRNFRVKLPEDSYANRNPNSYSSLRFS
jgi:hypothetical protein